MDKVNIGFESGCNALFVTDTMHWNNDGSLTVGEIELEETDWFHIYKRGSFDFELALKDFPNEYREELDTIIRLD